MILGRLLMSGTTDYSRWNDAPGEAVTVLHEAIVLENGVTLTVTVQTKDRGERDSSAVTATNGTISITSTGVSDTRATGIKDLWRLKVAVTGGTGDETFVHHRSQQPMWEVSGPLDAGYAITEFSWPAGQTLVRGGETAAYDTPWERTSTEQATFGVRVIALKQFYHFELELSGTASVGHVVHEILEPTWEEV